MLKVLKRNGTIVSFDVNKIVTAISLSMAETKADVDSDLAKSIGERVEATLRTYEQQISVEDIQDLVEELLMESPRKDAAKRYILYRYERDKNRDRRKKAYRWSYII